MGDPPPACRTKSFAEWVDHCFTGPKPEWNELAVDTTHYAPSWQELFRHFMTLFDDPAPVLMPRTDKELGDGIWFVFGHGSGFMQTVFSECGDALIGEFYRAIPRLYTEVFQHRCSNDLNSESKLDGGVYMMWDMDGLEWIIQAHSPTSTLREPFEECVRTILFNTANATCHSSALHAIWEASGIIKDLPRLIKEIAESEHFHPAIKQDALGILKGDHP